MWRSLLHVAAFTGRASRTEFAAVFAAFAIGIALIVALSPATRGSAVLPVALILLAYLILISVSVRRLHDLDKSGWVLCLYVVPIVGIVLLVWFFGRRGTIGPNRFGPQSELAELIARRAE